MSRCIIMKSMPKQTETKEMTIKEAANELDISESTIKKYLKDFDLTSTGSGAKATITQETFQALQEIAKLRANGLSIQEIKELKTQEPSKTILDEIEETVDLKAKTEEKPEEKEMLVEETDEDIEETKEESEGESDNVSADSEEAGEITDAPTSADGQQGEQTPRRRGFNYRYVERQISQDSKKVSSLRQRLKNPNLSVQDRLFFEESLERRILFLNGWKHILRWIAK